MNVSNLVASTLKHYFPNVKVNREMQADGSFTTPSFFVQQLETQSTLKPNSEQMRQYNYDVIYFSKSETHRVKELLDIEDEILSQFIYLLDHDGNKVAKIQGLRVVKQDEDLHILFSTQYRMSEVEGDVFAGDIQHVERFK